MPALRLAWLGYVLFLSLAAFLTVGICDLVWSLRLPPDGGAGPAGASAADSPGGEGAPAAWPPGSARVVVVYCSLDEVYADPVLRRFGERTGIEVRPVYDTEATKSVGLATRLAAERARPQADVFWNSEILRTLRLAEQGVLEPYRSPSAADIPERFRDSGGMWTGFAARARVLVWDTARVALAEAPRRLADLTDPKWKGQVGVARPQFGTTATHFAALFAAWGAERAEDFCRALRANDVKLLAGNSTVVDMVARGELRVGLTDTDDVWSALDEGKAVAMALPDAAGEGTLVIPNTLALVKGAPHPEAARALIDHLLSRAVEQELAAARSRQLPVRDVPTPPGVQRLPDIRALAVDFSALPGALAAHEAKIAELLGE